MGMPFFKWGMKIVINGWRMNGTRYKIIFDKKTVRVHKDL